MSGMMGREKVAKHSFAHTVLCQRLETFVIVTIVHRV